MKYAVDNLGNTAGRMVAGLYWPGRWRLHSSSIVRSRNRHPLPPGHSSASGLRRLVADPQNAYPLNPGADALTELTERMSARVALLLTTLVDGYQLLPLIQTPDLMLARTPATPFRALVIAGVVHAPIR